MSDKKFDALEELQMRRLVALAAVRTLAAEKNDPRARDAEAHYRAQLESLDKQIEAITGKPPDIVIGLKPGILFGESPTKEQR